MHDSAARTLAGIKDAFLGCRARKGPHVIAIPSKSPSMRRSEDPSNAQYQLIAFGHFLRADLIGIR
jgi:hypothetical protein